LRTGAPGTPTLPVLKATIQPSQVVVGMVHAVLMAAAEP